MFLSNKKTKLITLFFTILYMVMFFVVSNYASFIDINELYGKSKNIINVNFNSINRNHIKCLLDSQGNELIKTKGKDNDLGILFDVKDNKEKYLYSINRSYKDEKYYFSSYHYDILTKIDLFTIDGKYLDSI